MTQKFMERRKIMCRKSTCLASFVLALGFQAIGLAQARLEGYGASCSVNGRDLEPSFWAWNVGDETAWYPGCTVYLSEDTSPGGAVLWSGTFLIDYIDPNQSQGIGWGVYPFTCPDSYPVGTYYVVFELSHGGHTSSTQVTITEPPPHRTAHDPNPPNGARFIDPNVVLSWTAGEGAIIHDVYFGTDEALVASGDPSVSMDMLPDTWFNPGPLEPGKTYYWRIDEVEEDGMVYEGSVWSFSVQGDRETAYNPNPVDGAKFIDPNATLSWTEGFGAALHSVYFGTSIPPAFIGSQTETSYDFGALEYSTTYYWQVDEIEADGTIHQGNIWSFTTARPDLISVLDDFDDYTDPAERWTPTGGARIGHDIYTPGTPYSTLMERTIIHSGKQSMPLYYNNMDSPFSQADCTFSPPWDWTVDGASALTVYVYGEPPKFRETHRGDVVLSGAGADIWGTSDEFRFVYKTLNGNGSITARVLSNGTGSSAWAKGGVMIRPGLDAGSTHGMMVLTGGAGGGGAFQWRRSADDDSQSAHNPIPEVSPPYWVRIERIHNKLKGYLSQDGVNWTQQGEKEDIEMWKPKVFIGLCVTSHAKGELRTYDFANVQTTGDVYSQWQVEDVGVDQPSNDLAPLYVAVEDMYHNVGVVYHPDPNAVLAADWQEWTILFSEFRNAGVDLTAVETISLGVGDRKNSTPGNSLKLFATSPGESAGKVFWGDGVLLTGANVGTTQLLLKATVRDICDGTPIGNANNARLRFGGDPLYTNTAGVRYVPLTLGRDYDPVTVIADGFLMDYPHVWVCSDSSYPKRDFLLTPEPESLSCPIYCFRSSDSRYFYTLDKYESESQRYQEFRDRGDPVPSERDALLYNPNSAVPDDWTYECIAFRAWDSESDPNLESVHRFVHKELGIPVYTITKSEFENDSDWEYDDEEAFFAYPVDENGDPVEGTPNDAKPVRRIWHENLNCYSYTIGGDEGIVVWYALDRPKP